MSSSVVEVNLPAGKLGLVFRGDPPVIKGLSETSPLQDEVIEGYVIESLKLGDGTVCEGLNSTELGEKLKQSAESSDRKLILKAPDGVKPEADEDNPEPEGDKPKEASPAREYFHIGYVVEKELEDSDEGSQEIEVVLSSNTYVKTASGVVKPAEDMDTTRVTLPEGKLGLFFKTVKLDGKKRVFVSNISETSPMIDSLKVGDIVEELELSDGETFTEFDKDELGKHIQSSSEMEGRVLTVKRQEVGDLVTMTMSSLDLPAGKLGVAFKGSKKRVYVSKIAEDSPMKDIFQVGDVIDTLELPDGNKSSDFSSSQLGESLKDTSGTDGRIVIVKRKKPTEKSIMKTVDIPEGKLGVFFKGSTSVLVSKISDTSPVKEDFQVGDVVDSIELPGGEKFSKFTAKQLGEHLKKSSESTERKIILKRQESA